jgi:hypothetical protein
MKFRLKAFGLHFLGSASVLTLVLGGLYLGWYRWPGWYLTDVPHVAGMMGIVDLALGPLVTLLIANPLKPRRVLARDIAVIVAIQMAALVYGTTTLWQGRPLYYTFSEDRLEMVQASDLDATEIALARKQNPAFTPHWYSLPRWIWAPLPEDKHAREEIVGSAVLGGNDVIQMPRYFKPWGQGAPNLRKQLKKVDELNVFTKKEKQALKGRMSQLGLAPDQPATMFLTGRVRPVLAVFDRSTLQIKAIIRADGWTHGIEAVPATASFNP